MPRGIKGKDWNPTGGSFPLRAITHLPVLALHSSVEAPVVVRGCFGPIPRLWPQISFQNTQAALAALLGLKPRFYLFSHPRPPLAQLLCVKVFPPIFLRLTWANSKRNLRLRTFPVSAASSFQVPAIFLFSSSPQFPKDSSVSACWEIQRNLGSTLVQQNIDAQSYWGWGVL